MAATVDNRTQIRAFHAVSGSRDHSTQYTLDLGTMGVRGGQTITTVLMRHVSDRTRTLPARRHRWRLA